MEENNPSKFPAVFFVSVIAALLAAGAYRSMQVSAASATGAAVIGPAMSPPSPSTPSSHGEPTSNEIADFPQLD